MMIVLANRNNHFFKINKMSEDPIILEIVRETLDDSIMVLCFPYSELKRLEGMGIITIRDFRDYEFAEDEDKDVTNSQQHFKNIFWERDWNDIEE
jgi:hypothetical protein